LSSLRQLQVRRPRAHLPPRDLDHATHRRCHHRSVHANSRPLHDRRRHAGAPPRI